MLALVRNVKKVSKLYIDGFKKKNNTLNISSFTICRVCKGSIKCICSICKGYGKVYSDGFKEFICGRCYGKGVTLCTICNVSGKYNNLIDYDNF